MPLRLVQIIVPPDCKKDVDRALKGAEPAGRWTLDQPTGAELMEIVVEADQVEPLVDRFTDCFEDRKEFRVTLLPVEATRPPVEEDPDDPAGPDDSDGSRARVSRDELRSNAMEQAELTWVYLAMVAASTVVAAIGLLRDDVAVIIGAMVIAPLLGPNVALAMAA
ncbi:MAG TPA: hypothetical protein VM198_06350, partial [Longimicrobiales bacterium]|nr:hypothetical protein [Longimicrobiales bacterium]